MEEVKQVKITFDSEKVKPAYYSNCIYGIEVEEKEGKYFGKCSEEIKKALKDAGKCE